MLYKKNSVEVNLLCLLFVLDVLFVIAYIISRIMDINIGTVISLRNRYGYWWNIEDDMYVVYRAGDRVKTFKTENEAMNYARKSESRDSALAYVVNFFKRALFRYPYFSLINIVIVLLVIFL